MKLTFGRTTRAVGAALFSLSLLVACGSSSSSGQGNGGTCTGPTPNCFGANTASCCGQDPAGEATCENGTWMCGKAEAPGCNGTSCLATAGDDGGAEAAADASSCAGPRPLCFGANASMCCGQDPAGDADCVNGAWMCGAAPAPGCNGTSCLLQDSGSD